MSASIPNIRTLYANVLKQIEDMLAHPPEKITQSSTGVSRWNIGQHHEHLALTGLVIMKVIGAPLVSPAPHIHESPNMQGGMVLLMGRIPRGVAQAPDYVMPSAQPDPVETKARLKQYLTEFSKLEPRLTELEQYEGRFPHPALGFFTIHEWLRLIEVHQRHHMEIVKDIETAR